MPQPEYIIAPYILRDVEKYFNNRLAELLQDFNKVFDKPVDPMLCVGLMLKDTSYRDLLQAMGLRLSYRSDGFCVSFLR